MNIPRATAVRRALFAAGFIALLVWLQLPWLRHTLAPPPDSGLRTETLRIFARDCSKQRGPDFTVEIADTEEARRTGLQGRKYLPRNRGMLFVWPDSAIRSMWMRDTPISLDMVFIREDGVINEMVHRRRPNSDALISSGLPAHAVLELRAGRLHKLDVRGGDRIQHPAFSGRNCAPDSKTGGQ